MGLRQAWKILSSLFLWKVPQLQQQVKYNIWGGIIMMRLGGKTVEWKSELMCDDPLEFSLRPYFLTHWPTLLLWLYLLSLSLSLRELLSHLHVTSSKSKESVILPVHDWRLPRQGKKWIAPRMVSGWGRREAKVSLKSENIFIWHRLFASSVFSFHRPCPSLPPSLPFNSVSLWETRKIWSFILKVDPSWWKKKLSHNFGFSVHPLPFPFSLHFQHFTICMPFFRTEEEEARFLFL